MSFREDANFGQITVAGKDAASGTKVTRIKKFSQTITPGAVGAANVSGTVQAFAVAGLLTTDTVVVNPAPTGNATTVGAAYVSGVNQITIHFNNPTAGGLTPGAGTYNILAFGG